MNTLAKHKRITPDIIDAKLNRAGFQTKTSITELSDPIADTAMMVTLDELRSYENNPRTTRNPSYDDIKESIRSRGLDNPPPITRRPGESFYIIRNGGNTRLQILQELWRETKDEKFYRIHCLFRPWQSEASVLVGHLAENEVRGNLSFVEKAVGVKQLKDLYESETEGKKVTQNELVKRLKEDGFPVSRQHIGRMLDCVETLLPAIPEILYRGLGKHQIEKLLSLRTGLQEVHKSHGDGDKEAFMDFWIAVLSGFDMNPNEYNISRIEDELIGQLGKLIGREYKMIQLDLAALKPDRNERIEEDEEPLRPPTSKVAEPPVEVVPPGPSPAKPAPTKAPGDEGQRETKKDAGDAVIAPPQPADASPPLTEEERQQRIAAHIVSPVTTTPRVKEILRRVAAHDGEILPDFDECAVTAIPVQAGGKIANVADVWYIEGRHDDPASLRQQIYLLAAEIAMWGGSVKYVNETGNEGLGFCINSENPMPDDKKGATAIYLLHAVLRLFVILPDDFKITFDAGLISQVLIGSYDIQIGPYPAEEAPLERLPDDVLIRFFRLIRLARRLVDLVTKRGES